MRLHLGHHFYGAGNVGDDFMLAGFLNAMRTLAPDATFTSCVPFPIEPLRRRFPAVNWLPYEDNLRRRSIQDCDAWLGLGGSPFQSAQSRWFIDHLSQEAKVCRQRQKPMYYLGIGVQTATELRLPEAQSVCGQSAAIWTRDAASADRLRQQTRAADVRVSADLAHLCFERCRPALAVPGRLTVVPNFDYAGWPGMRAFLEATNGMPLTDRVWMAQESRLLPGSEQACFNALSPEEQRKWRLVVPEQATGESTPDGSREALDTLRDLLQGWPSGEWLVSARLHSALAGAWAGSKVVVIGTNEKLRAAAESIGAPVIDPNASAQEVGDALRAAHPSMTHTAEAKQAFAACREFVETVSGRPKE